MVEKIESGDSLLKTIMHFNFELEQLILGFEMSLRGASLIHFEKNWGGCWKIKNVRDRDRESFNKSLRNYKSFLFNFIL